MSTTFIVAALALLPIVFAAVAALFADKRPRRTRRSRHGATGPLAMSAAGPVAR
jgi:hypothetical protein